MNYLFILFISIIVVIFFKNNNYNWNNKIITVTSNIDNRDYIVLDFNDSLTAANTLAEINKKIEKLFDVNKSSNLEPIKRLIRKYNPSSLCELENDSYTAYSLNKGEKIAICLRDVKSKKLINDINTTMFIIIHELAHIMSVTEQHTEEFWNNMKLLIYKCKECGIYTPIDYSKNNIYYCNQVINSNPYFKNK